MVSSAKNHPDSIPSSTAGARLERKFTSECDEAESFCEMLEGWLDGHKHWMSNGHAGDLMNAVRDLITDQRHEITKDRESAGQDAVDTVGDAQRSAAA